MYGLTNPTVQICLVYAGLAWLPDCVNAGSKCGSTNPSNTTVSSTRLLVALISWASSKPHPRANVNLQISSLLRVEKLIICHNYFVYFPLIWSLTKFFLYCKLKSYLSGRVWKKRFGFFFFTLPTPATYF